MSKKISNIFSSNFEMLENEELRMQFLLHEVLHFNLLKKNESIDKNIQDPIDRNTAKTMAFNDELFLVEKAFDNPKEYIAPFLEENPALKAFFEKEEITA